MSLRGLLSRAAVLAVACVAVLLVAGPATASASGGWWVLAATAAPTNLQPGQPAVVTFKASNTGYGTIVGSKEHPIVLRATLPAGFEATKSLDAFAGPENKSDVLKREPHHLTCKVEGRTVTCPYEGSIPPTESIRLKAAGQMNAATPVGSTEEVAEVSGGDAAAPEPYEKKLQVTTAATPFGAMRYEIRPENEKGEPETQAGAHPFQLTSIFDLNEKVVEVAPTIGEPQEFPTAAALPKDLNFVLPPGLIGKAAGVPRCTASSFSALQEGGSNTCEQNSAIGYAVVSIFNPVIQGYAEGTVPVFNLEPEEGEPARFGFEFHKVPVVLRTKVRSGKDYGVEVSVHEAPQSAAVVTTQLTLWGVPQDSRHNAERGWACIQEGTWLEEKHPNCETQAQIETRENKRLAEEEKPPRPPEEAFLSMPTACEGVPATTAEGVSWNGESFGPISYSFFSGPSGLGGSPFTGCPKLAFEPSISVTPVKPQAATPSGYTVTVATDQKGTVTGKELADAAIKSTTLKLPAGVFASAGASQGLGTCTTEGFGFEGGSEPLSSEAFGKLLANNEFSTAQLNETTCPASAKIGTVDIETPLLDEHLTGSVYLGHHDTNPFMSPLVLFIFAETPASEAFVKKGGEPKVQVKLAGEVKFGDPSRGEPQGQITSTFGNTPPVQFSKLTLNLNDGPRAAQATPEKCGSYESAAEFEASSNQKRTATSSFAINEGAGGGPCNPAFAPSTEAGADSGQAGAFSPFKVVIRKPDGQNQLRSINVTEPPGAAAILAGVAQCPTATAEQIAPETLPKRDAQSSAECPASSIIGKSVAVAGLGSGTYGAGAARVTLPGTVYLTGPYHGAPFGLLDVTDTRGHTGPFELGKIGVMSRILVDENTAQATVVSNPLPQFVEGVPASISEIMVDVDRPGFSFNPTNCSPLEVTGVADRVEPGRGAGRQLPDPLAVPRLELRVAAVQTEPDGRTRTERQPSRRHGPRREAQSGERRSQHPQDEAGLPDLDPVASDDDPEILRRPHLQRQPGQLPGRLRSRHCDRAHTRAEIAAGRAGLPGVARQRLLPGRRVRAPGRRHQAPARRQDRHQKRHHELELRIRPRRAGRNLRSETAARPALRLQRLRRPVRHAAEPADRIRRPERRHDQLDHESEARQLDQHAAPAQCAPRKSCT